MPSLFWHNRRAVGIHFDMKKKYKKNKFTRSNVENYQDGLRQRILSEGFLSEVLLQEPFLTIVGNKELWLENYKAILLCEENKILIATKESRILIEGEHLVINHYMEEHMMICGKVRSIMYI